MVKKKITPVEDTPQVERDALLEEQSSQEVASDPQPPENENQDASMSQEENGTPEDEQSSEAPETASEEGEPETQNGTHEKRKLTISNPTKSVRGLMLKKGVMLLQPGEIKVVPDEAVDEVRALFKSKSVQAIVDAGMLRFSGLGDEDLVEQPTPTPPSELTNSVQVGDTGLTVGANSSRQYDPASANKIKDAGVMNIG